MMMMMTTTTTTMMMLLLLLLLLMMMMAMITLTMTIMIDWSISINWTELIIFFCLTSLPDVTGLLLVPHIFWLCLSMLMRILHTHMSDDKIVYQIWLRLIHTRWYFNYIESDSNGFKTKTCADRGLYSSVTFNFCSFL